MHLLDSHSCTIQTLFVRFRREWIISNIIYCLSLRNFSNYYNCFTRCWSITRCESN
uniref:Putative tail fiber n=1 Tax=uncultured marine virus TaxID=186617 RepID=A0A0F7LB51_9VIRU|nr:putative tail fiber [uncultured marine virus]